jgi:DNA-binding NarL/FixJ family response regulator
MTTFLIADDHSVVRSGLVIIIKTLFKDASIFQASNFNEIEKTLTNETVDILILDISFPEGNSLNIISNLKLEHPNIKILMFSSYEEDIYALRYIKAGADGYLSKLSTPDEIEVALMKMVKDGKFTSSKIKDKIIDSFMFNKPENPLDELSDREMEIATLMVNGMGNLEISNVLKLKATTISTYKNRIFEKLGVNNLSALIQFFNLHND